jgi:tRNA modification GTPase
LILSPSDPIVAIATAPGRGAVGIVRVSGRGLQDWVSQLLGQTLKLRVATYVPIRDSNAEVLDQGLALFFAGPHSYTGEDVLELQVHGGPVVLQLVLAHCLQVGQPLGLRLAQPGEFTQRAFLNDKLDLAQAEAVADLIDASTEAASRSASRSLSGHFSNHVTQLKDRLIHLRMLVEATLDFPEEEIDFLEKADAKGQLHSLLDEVNALLARARQGALLREGMKVVLAGQPNVGKSSLLNALAGAELAIVTPIPGTTRDKVSQTLQIDGVPVHVIDTAGLREAGDEVERIGVQRSWEEIEAADAVLLLQDLSRVNDPGYQALQRDIEARLPASLLEETRLVRVWNKADLGPPSMTLAPTDLVISAQTGHGLQTLRQRLLQLAGWQATAEGVFAARERHLQALRATQCHLQEAQTLAHQAHPALDLLAEELRLAQRSLSEITGEFTPDDLLGEIFSRFCIGK